MPGPVQLYVTPLFGVALSVTEFTAQVMLPLPAVVLIFTTGAVVFCDTLITAGVVFEQPFTVLVAVRL